MSDNDCEGSTIVVHATQPPRDAGPTLSARELSDADLPALLRLCQSNPQYYAHLDTKPSAESLAADMRELPPGCNVEQKSYQGFFSNGNDLVAVLDLVRGYPDKTCAFIGLFMVDSAWQGKGIGSSLVARTVESLRMDGFQRMRLAYVAGNEQSRRFWEKCGFAAAGDPIPCGAYAVVPMELALS